MSHDPDALLDLDATDQAAAVRDGRTSAPELVEAAIVRIEQRNGAINAVIRTRWDRARQEARLVDPARPLAGVPILVKDFDGRLAGEPLTAGMRGAHRDGWRERETSRQIEDLQAAGAVVLGWTNTPELGMMPTTEPLLYGPTRNPWAPGYSVGGSSGGSAAAVAAGMVAIAQGGDGAGSLRIPAAACGVATLKPSRGAVSLGPHESEKTAGYVTKLGLARSVRDLRLMFELCGGPRLGDPYGPALARDRRAARRPLRIGLMTVAPAAISDVAPACRESTEAAARLLVSLGHEVEEVHPAALESSESMVHRNVVRSAWARHMLDQWGRKLGRALGPDDVEPLTWATAEEGRGLEAARYLEAVDALQAWSREVLGWWRGRDLLLTPTLAAPPPPIGALDSPPGDVFAGRRRAAPYVAFTMPFNVTGQPAASLPFGRTADGLPLGVQLVAAPGEEALLLDLCAEIERAAPWPPIAPATTAHASGA